MMPFRMCHVPVLISGSGANADVLRTGQPSRAVYGSEAEHGEQWGGISNLLDDTGGRGCDDLVSDKRHRWAMDLAWLLDGSCLRDLGSV